MRSFARNSNKLPSSRWNITNLKTIRKSESNSEKVLIWIQKSNTIDVSLRTLPNIETNNIATLQILSSHQGDHFLMIFVVET